MARNQKQQRKPEPLFSPRRIIMQPGGVIWAHRQIALKREILHKAPLKSSALRNSVSVGLPGTMYVIHKATIGHPVAGAGGDGFRSCRRL